jgi:hypothetical protein
MSDSQNVSEKILGHAWAARIAATLLLGYAAVALFAAHEKSQRAELERVAEPTAVGDTAYFPLPRPWDVKKPLAVFEGTPLYFMDWSSLPDSMMQKAGRADSAAFMVYKFHPATSQTQTLYFLKVNTNLYAAVRPEQPPN